MAFSYFRTATLFLTTHLKSPLIPERQNDIIYQLFPPSPPSTLRPCILLMLQNISDSHSNVSLTLTLYIILSSHLVFSISFLRSSHLYFLCYAMAGYTNANRIWTYESKNESALPSFLWNKNICKPSLWSRVDQFGTRIM